MIRPAAFLLVVVAGTASGQDKPDPAKVAAQKTTAVTNAKKAGVDRPAVAETDDLIVVAGVPDAKAKAIADAAQKTFAATRTALKIDAKDTLWPGKLAVYVFPDRRNYANFVRTVEQRQPEKGVWYGLNTRSETPYIAVSEELGETTTDADRIANVGAMAAAAVANKKAGATPATPLPEWLLLGFGRAAHARAAGGKVLSDFKTRAKTVAAGTKSRPSLARAADVWSGTKTKDSDALAASLTDYMAFGPEAEKFPKFLAGFKPGEDIANPTTMNALDAAEWPLDALEVGWKKWAYGGK